MFFVINIVAECRLGIFWDLGLQTWDDFMGPGTLHLGPGTRTHRQHLEPGTLCVIQDLGPFTWDSGVYMCQPGPNTFTWNTGSTLRKKMFGSIANWSIESEKTIFYMDMFIVKSMAGKWKEWYSAMETVILNKFSFVPNCNTQNRPYSFNTYS